MIEHEFFSLLSFVFCEVVPASFKIELIQTRHFSYSFGSVSSMYFFILLLDYCLRYDKSLLTVAGLTCSIVDMSL
jgi:hypothetical protein